VNDTDHWLERFDKSENRLPATYRLASLLVILGLVGVLWAVPVPGEFYQISPLFNWGSAFLMATGVYYFIVSLSLAIGLLPFLVGVAAFEFWLRASGYAALNVSIGLFATGVAGLWLSQRSAGLRGMVRELQHIMLVPAWMLANAYRKLGIPV
jgi:hypothetical protein